MVKVREDLPQHVDGRIDIEAWLKRGAYFYAPEDQGVLRVAVLLSLEHGTTHFTPVQMSCFRQGLLTAETLLALRPDISTLAASVVYFCAQYANLTLEIIASRLGSNVRNLVEGSLHLSHHASAGLTIDLAAQRENFRRLLLAVVQDVRVVLIKLAERLTSLQAASSLESFVQQQLAREAREIYAPLANRLGIGQVKWEMEDFAFRYLEPTHYKQIAKLLDEKRSAREGYIQRVVRHIEVTLAQEGIEAQVFGRAKHIYSIWRKMSAKNIDFSDIYDVRAIRILVEDVQNCYACLGIIHHLWQYIAREFDDYIATPKENGYRSLHTAVIGPEGKTLEVQIRTYAMHTEADLGVAAHWLYKEGLQNDQKKLEKKLKIFRQFLDWQAECDARDIDHDHSMYNELFDDQVYVFTPKGDVIDLPKGSTPLDFAYQVHSEVGHRCRGAKVNGAIVPLIYILQSGEQVEILQVKEPRPSRDWLNPHLGYLRSARARSKVHHWFRQQDRDKNMIAGREALDQEIRRLGVEKLDLEWCAQKLGLRKAEDVLVAIGRGDVRIGQLLQWTPLEVPAPPTLHISNPKQGPHHKRDDIYIEGVGNLLSHYAQCCKPVPGDMVIGYITVGRGVSVHRKDCLHMLEAQEHKENRLIAVQWGSDIHRVYAVDIGVVAYDRRGLLNDITSILSHASVNVIGANTQTRTDNTAILYLTLEISSLAMLDKVLSKMALLPNVLEVYRVLNT